MCGRFTLLTPWSELVKLYRIADEIIARETLWKEKPGTREFGLNAN